MPEAEKPYELVIPKDTGTIFEKLRDDLLTKNNIQYIDEPPPNPNVDFKYFKPSNRHRMAQLLIDRIGRDGD